jgi:hypothetical protein
MEQVLKPAPFNVSSIPPGEFEHSDVKINKQSCLDLKGSVLPLCLLSLFQEFWLSTIIFGAVCVCTGCTAISLKLMGFGCLAVIVAMLNIMLRLHYPKTEGQSLDRLGIETPDSLLKTAD